MLGSGEAHTLGAQGEGRFEVFLGLGVAPDLDALVLASPAEQPQEPLVHLLALGLHLLPGQLRLYGRGNYRKGPEEDFAGGPVYGDDLAGG